MHSFWVYLAVLPALLCSPSLAKKSVGKVVAENLLNGESPKAEIVYDLQFSDDAELRIYKAHDLSVVSRRIKINGPLTAEAVRMYAQPLERWRVPGASGSFGNFIDEILVKIPKELRDGDGFILDQFRTHIGYQTVQSYGINSRWVNLVVDLDHPTVPLSSLNLGKPLEQQAFIRSEIGARVRVLGMRRARLQVVEEQELIRWLRGMSGGIHVLEIDPALVDLASVDAGLNKLIEDFNMKWKQPGGPFVQKKSSADSRPNSAAEEFRIQLEAGEAFAQSTAEGEKQRWNALVACSEADRFIPLVSLPIDQIGVAAAKLAALSESDPTVTDVRRVLPRDFRRLGCDEDFRLLGS